MNKMKVKVEAELNLDTIPNEISISPTTLMELERQHGIKILKWEARSVP